MERVASSIYARSLLLRDLFRLRPRRLGRQVRAELGDASMHILFVLRRRGGFQTAGRNRSTESAEKKQQIRQREARRFGPTKSCATSSHRRSRGTAGKYRGSPWGRSELSACEGIPSYQPADHCDLFFCRSFTSPVRLIFFFLIPTTFVSPLVLAPFSPFSLTFFTYL